VQQHHQPSVSRTVRQGPEGKLASRQHDVVHIRRRYSAEAE
jgi:hypothetical protein